MNVVFLKIIFRPYFVTPDTGVLDVGKSMQIELSFDPQKTKGHKSYLVVRYETGNTSSRKATC